MKVHGFQRAATAVTATTSGSSADKSWEASDFTSASAANLCSAPNESSVKFPSRLCSPTLPIKGEEVEHPTAIKGPRPTFLVVLEIPFGIRRKELFFMGIEFLETETRRRRGCLGAVWSEKQGVCDIARVRKARRRNLGGVFRRVVVAEVIR